MYVEGNTVRRLAEVPERRQPGRPQQPGRSQRSQQRPQTSRNRQTQQHTQTALPRFLLFSLQDGVTKTYTISRSRKLAAAPASTMSGSTPSGVETASRPLLILVNTPIILSFHYQLQRNRSRYIAVTVHRRVSQRISARFIRAVVT